MKSDINVTPMIDVLLVLLVIFILSAQMRMIVPVHVPAPTPKEQGPASPQVVLNLEADGSYTINEAPVPLRGLESRLRELFGDGRRKVLYVRAAPQRRYREVIEAVDLARGAGVTMVGYMP